MKKTKTNREEDEAKYTNLEAILLKAIETLIRQN